MKGNDMIAIQCACGFSELADETITDHLHTVFAPEDMRGHDGLIHDEMTGLACSCGFGAITADELDEHLLRAFAPDDGIGRDGTRHGRPGEAW
jgi:hypothetical protein